MLSIIYKPFITSITNLCFSELQSLSLPLSLLLSPFIYHLLSLSLSPISLYQLSLLAFSVPLPRNLCTSPSFYAFFSFYFSLPFSFPLFLLFLFLSKPPLLLFLSFSLYLSPSSLSLLFPISRYLSYSNTLNRLTHSPTHCLPEFIKYSNISNPSVCVFFVDTQRKVIIVIMDLQTYTMNGIPYNSEKS